MLKLFRVTFTQIFNTGNSFFDFDLLIFLFFSFSRKTLPRQLASDEIHQDNSNLLQIISPCLLNTQVGIQTCISSSSSQRFIVFKTYMSACFRIFISFRKSEIYNVYHMLLLLCSYQKIIWFYISMQEPVLVYEFDSLKHLYCQH